MTVSLTSGDDVAPVAPGTPAQTSPSAAPAAGGGAERDLRSALRRGWRRRCPSCGGGALFDGYLAVRPRCPSCGQDLSGQRADDLPAWATILVTGHVIAPLMITAFQFDLPMYLHWFVWPVLTLAITLVLLPRIKGAVIGLQWAQRLAGFGKD